MKQKWSALQMPHAIEVQDQVHEACSFDPDIYRLETERQWPLSNYRRVIDGCLAGLPTEKIVPGLPKVNLNPLEQPVAEIEI